jgi:hypothetical protein
LNPDVRAVLCTGYGFNIAAQELLDEGILDFISKPFEPGRSVVGRVAQPHRPPVRIAASFAASMFPTRHTRSSRLPAFPESAAATGTAPAPSATTWFRSTTEAQRRGGLRRA